jgi:nitrate reductase assembly molybdenum cofactor insertion protein NarJ
MILWTLLIGLLKENGETETLAALNRLDAGRLNEVIVIFTQFIKCVERNFVSYFNTFRALCVRTDMEKPSRRLYQSVSHKEQP